MAKAALDGVLSDGLSSSPVLLSLCICKAHGRSTLSLRVKVGSLFKPGAPRRQWKAREVKCQDGNLAVIGLGTWTGANATASSDDLPHGYRLDPLASSASRRRRLDLNRVDQSAKADSGARSWPIQLLAVPGVAPSSDARQSVAMGRKCRGGGGVQESRHAWHFEEDMFDSAKDLGSQEI